MTAFILTRQMIEEEVYYDVLLAAQNGVKLVVTVRVTDLKAMYRIIIDKQVFGDSPTLDHAIDLFNRAVQWVTP